MKKPLYRDLQEKLKKDIQSGKYNEGSMLPSENELREKFGFNRSTIRQALNELVKDGYITRQHGKGSIVISRKRKSLGLLSVKGFSEIVSSQARKVHTQMLLSPTLTSWDTNFFYPLTEREIKMGCIYLNRIRYADDIPVMLEHTFIPNKNLAKLCIDPLINNSLFETLQKEYNIEFVNVEQDLRAQNANAEEAELLKVNESDALLHIYLKFISEKNFNVYSYLVCNTSKFSIGNLL